MGPDQSRNLEIRFTLRHSLILIAYTAFLFKMLISALEVTGHQGAWNLLIATLLVSPPLLALLVVIIGRAGPMKNWSVSFLIFLFWPAVVLNHDRVALLDYVRYGRYPMFWGTLLLNAVLVAYTLVYVGRMAPRTCPGCQRRTLIPLMRLFKKDRRSSNTYWCASCGGKYRKDQEGNWRGERRETWLDGSKEPPTPRAMKAAAGGRPEVAKTTHRLLGRRSVNETHPS
jgi:hypothetical protein